MPTINDLRQQAATIKNATQVGENTATRVGTTFETIADLLEGANVGQGIPSVDLAQLNSLRTPADQTTTNPTVYNVTTLHNLSSTTIKVGTLFIFSDGGRAVVTQILLSNYQVDGGGNISSPNTSQITMYYRMFNIVQETWSAWTLYAGGGGGGTIDPYPVSGSDNAVASNGVFEGLQKTAPEVDINDIDDLDDYVNMQTGEASTYTIKAYHNLSSTWLRVGVLMVFANQANNTLTQICISNCMVDGGGNLIPNYTTNVMNVFYRFKQFSGNPPEGMTIGVWTTWAKFGDSGYQPDNEDIDLNASDQLQFANKLHDASAFSGLGRVYLRKNIVTLEGTDKNVLTQAMINTANTIYHIQYDYDLNGQTITLPAGCVLEFDGGCLSNGEITGNGTSICASLTKIFGLNIVLSGRWNVMQAYPEWFGAVGDGITDDTSFLQQCFTNADTAAWTEVVLSAQTRQKFYVVSSPIIVRNVNVRGFYDGSGNKQATIKASDGFTFTTIDGYKYNSIFIVEAGKVHFKNLYLDGNLRCNLIQYKTIAKGTIEECLFYQYIVAIVIYGAEDITLASNYFNYGAIAVRASNKILDIDSNLYRPQNNQSTFKSVNIVHYYDNYILSNNIGVYHENGSNVNFIHNTTAHNQIFAVLAFNVRALTIRDSYSEGDGACAHDVMVDGAQNGTTAALTTSESLINNNVDGMVMNSVHYHGIYCVSNSKSVIVCGNSISYKKRGEGDENYPQKNEYRFGHYDFTRERAGVDAILLDMCCANVYIQGNGFYNWNAQGVPNAPLHACTIYGTITGKSYDSPNDILYTTTNKSIDKAIYDPMLIAETALITGEDAPIISSKSVESDSFNSSLRFDKNNYKNALDGLPAAYNETRGQSWNAMDVEYIKTINGIPFYRHTSTSSIYTNITNDENFQSVNYLEVCRFILDVNTTSNPIITLYHYNTSGRNALVVASTTRSTYNRHGGMWLQRMILRDAKEVQDLRNVIIIADNGLGTLENMQKFLFSPFFVRELGSELVPNFNNYELNRKNGKTTERPTLTSSDIGFVYYDTTLKKPVYWNGSAWTDATGTAL